MLGTLERQVVAALKSLGSGTTREILEELHRREVNVAYTTVGTILARLHRKGLVNRRQEPYRGADRYVYAYKDIEATYIDSMLQALVAAFGERGVVHLAERIDDISPADLRRLRERLKV
ncbi:MAG: BlaI/MecI/CopY family transcriptional regulator [Euryarchaeota archaeon]|nr:BlaI/MecI/CopY family transcriptional regulator [Euryarchaeota archaeon]